MDLPGKPPVSPGNPKLIPSFWHWVFFWVDVTKWHHLHGGGMVWTMKYFNGDLAFGSQARHKLTIAFIISSDIEDIRVGFWWRIMTEKTEGKKIKHLHTRKLTWHRKIPTMSRCISYLTFGDFPASHVRFHGWISHTKKLIDTGHLLNGNPSGWIMIHSGKLTSIMSDNGLCMSGCISDWTWGVSTWNIIYLNIHSLSHFVRVPILDY